MARVRSLRLGGMLAAAILLAGVAHGQVATSRGQSVYVPVYSHIYGADQEKPLYLAATLSIRNTDRTSPLTLLAVDYYGQDGKRIRAYVEQPVTVGPLGAVRYFVKESDVAGGSGASFVVRWRSEVPVTAPLIESVMIGTRGQQGLSFTSRGQVIAED